MNSLHCSLVWCCVPAEDIRFHSHILIILHVAPHHLFTYVNLHDTREHRERSSWNFHHRNHHRAMNIVWWQQRVRICMSEWEWENRITTRIAWLNRKERRKENEKKIFSQFFSLFSRAKIGMKLNPSTFDFLPVRFFHCWISQHSTSAGKVHRDVNDGGCATKAAYRSENWKLIFFSVFFSIPSNVCTCWSE